MVALVYGGLYTLTDSQTSIQDRFGLLSLVAIVRQPASRPKGASHETASPCPSVHLLALTH